MSTTGSMTQRDVYIWTGDVMAALRSTLDDLDFTEILPVILSERHEPGARHGVAVLGDQALPDISVKNDGNGKSSVSVTGGRYYYLPVSHCVEKQLALEHTDRVFCIAPCVRLVMEGEEMNRAGFAGGCLV